jgi:hypothetical protein
MILVRQQRATDCRWRCAPSRRIYVSADSAIISIGSRACQKALPPSVSSSPWRSPLPWSWQVEPPARPWALPRLWPGGLRLVPMSRPNVTEAEATCNVAVSEAAVFFSDPDPLYYDR